MTASERALRARPGQPPGEAAILDAAVRLFSELGFDGVSMRAVARKAGVSKANIYHHFDSKEALYVAVLNASVSETADLLHGLASRQERFEEGLAGFAHAHLEHLFANPLTSRLLLREALNGDPARVKTIVDQVIGGSFREMVAIFEAGQRSGELRTGPDPALCAFMLTGINFFFFQALEMLAQVPEAGFAQRPELFGERMMEILLRGMLRTGESSS